MTKCLALILAIIGLLISYANANGIRNGESLVYGYNCDKGVCVKLQLSPKNFDDAISLPVCRMICGDVIGTLLPKPKKAIFDNFVTQVDLKEIRFQFPNHTDQTELWASVQRRFSAQLNAKLPGDQHVVSAGGYPMNIKILVEEAEADRLALDADESYRLVVDKSLPEIVVMISAKTFYGARHGLESLAQLFVYDDIRRELVVLAKADISDEPAFKWRSVLLDTSRNFFSVKAIKRTLDAMSMVKLNTFHWHITDSHSFPLELRKQPEFHTLGAYSPRKVYSQAEIRDVVAYANVRGIRIIPEFDAPAHVGEGWQNKNLTACFRAQPWTDYCVEPPCGQLDPTVDELYVVLEDIYSEMFDIFKPEIFHMGGDEVSIKCWNSSERIRNYMQANKLELSEAGYMKLWREFQAKALARVRSVSGNAKLPVILWTSRLTDRQFIDYLSKHDYVIQVWTSGLDKKVGDILERGFHIIVSNTDALYFDCGGPGWVKDGNNWCSPYIGWQKVYDNKMRSIAGDYIDQVLGAEAAVWSEQIDEYTLDARLWPRASALAERLWSDPVATWRQAESRMLIHREWLVENGIGAEALQPHWCVQNEGECPETRP